MGTQLTALRRTRREEQKGSAETKRDLGSRQHENESRWDTESEMQLPRHCQVSKSTSQALAVNAGMTSGDKACPMMRIQPC